MISHGGGEDDDVEEANWGHIGATPLAGPLLMLLLPRIVLIHIICGPHDDMEAYRRILSCIGLFHRILPRTVLIHV